MLSKAFAVFGYELASAEHLAALEQRASSDNYLLRRQKIMKHHGVEFVIDVGANEGQFARSLRSLGFRGQILSIEPLASAYGRLRDAASNDPLWTCVHCGLADREGSAVINVSANSYSSSLLPMRNTHLDAAPDSRYVGTETVALRTLNSVFRQFVPPESRTYLKLDTQGFERKILEGGTDALKRIALIQIEASLCNLYEGDSLIGEMIELLHRDDFVPISIEPGFCDEATGRQFQVDVIFSRQPGTQANAMA